MTQVGLPKPEETGGVATLTGRMGATAGQIAQLMGLIPEARAVGQQICQDCSSESLQVSRKRSRSDTLSTGAAVPVRRPIILE
jgi:NADPH-dependent curcumin reductase CurA